MKRHKYKRDVLNYTKIHLENLPRGRGEDRGPGTLEVIYQTYTTYVKYFPLWSRLQLPQFYAAPTSSLTSLVHLLWRKKAIQSVKEEQIKVKNIRAAAAQEKKPRPAPKFDEKQLVEKMRWMLMEEIYRYLIAWKCVPPKLASVVAGRIALRVLTKPKKVSLTEVCLEEAGRFISRKNCEDYDEMINTLRLFAIEELPRIRQRAWLAMAEWRGRSLGSQVDPKLLPSMEELKQAVGILKGESVFSREFLSTLLKYHAACLASLD